MNLNSYFKIIIHIILWTDFCESQILHKTIEYTNIDYKFRNRAKKNDLFISNIKIKDNILVDDLEEKYE